MAISAMAGSAPRAHGEHPQGFGRKRDQEPLPLGDAEIAHEVRGEIRDQRARRVDLRTEPGAAEGAEELEAPHLDGDRVRVACLNAADADLLGPNPELHRSPRREATVVD